MPSAPTASDLKARYPAFASVPDSTVDLWINDAQRIVTAGWSNVDYAPALMALAAHNMALQGLGVSGASAGLPAGLTSFRSASLSVSFSEAAAAQQVAGGYSSTPYGREFAPMLRRNVGGLHLVGCAA